jgi:hypothetical protein
MHTYLSIQGLGSVAEVVVRMKFIELAENSKKHWANLLSANQKQEK